MTLGIKSSVVRITQPPLARFRNTVTSWSLSDAVLTVTTYYNIRRSVVRSDTDHSLYLLGGYVVQQRGARVSQRRLGGQHAVHAHLGGDADVGQRRPARRPLADVQQPLRRRRTREQVHHLRHDTTRTRHGFDTGREETRARAILTNRRSASCSSTGRRSMLYAYESSAWWRRSWCSTSDTSSRSAAQHRQRSIDTRAADAKQESDSTRPAHAQRAGERGR